MSKFRQQHVHSNFQIIYFLEWCFFPALHDNGWRIQVNFKRNVTYSIHATLLRFLKNFTGSDNNDVNKFHFNDETDSIISNYLKSN